MFNEREKREWVMVEKELENLPLEQRSELDSQAQERLSAIEDLLSQDETELAESGIRAAFTSSPRILTHAAAHLVELVARQSEEEGNINRMLRYFQLWDYLSGLQLGVEYQAKGFSIFRAKQEELLKMWSRMLELKEKFVNGNEFERTIRTERTTEELDAYAGLGTTYFAANLEKQTTIPHSFTRAIFEELVRRKY